jgi:hypothetical protein
MSASERPPVVLHADQEHSGIRFAIFIGLFVGFIIGYFLVSRLLQALGPVGWQDYHIFLSCAGSVPVALLFIWLLEKFLKRVWHSGLSIALDDLGLYVDDRRGGAPSRRSDEPAMIWADNMGQLRWYFRLSGYPRGGRERRVPAKWLCLAVELQQDESRLSAYTFMPPDKAAAWTQSPKQGFHIINLAELYQGTTRMRVGPPERPNLPNYLLQTKEARYWLAERRRWEYGIELTPEDFARLLDYASRGASTAGPTTNEATMAQEESHV